MTFKATSPKVIRAVSTGLEFVHPLRPSPKPQRGILATPAIRSIIAGDPPVKGFPHLCADLIIGRFTAGHYLLISRSSASDCDLEQLEEIDEVWALCFRKPRPGWRLLGRFLEQDTFIGLRLCDRKRLAHRKNYGQKASVVIDDWNERFGSLGPLRSDDLSAYLSGYYRDVDQEAR